MEIPQAMFQFGIAFRNDSHDVIPTKQESGYRFLKLRYHLLLPFGMTLVINHKPFTSGSCHSDEGGICAEIPQASLSFAVAFRNDLSD